MLIGELRHFKSRQTAPIPLRKQTVMLRRPKPVTVVVEFVVFLMVPNAK